MWCVIFVLLFVFFKQQTADEMRIIDWSSDVCSSDLDMLALDPRDDDLYFLPLGGSDEIGMNLNLYGYAGRWLMVDLGITFADDSMPGLDIILPDVEPIVRHRDRLDGLLLTHGQDRKRVV